MVGSDRSGDRFWWVGTVGFLQQHTNNKSPQQQTANHQHNQKKKSTHNNNKSPNTNHKSPILDRTSESEGGAVVELARSGQNPVRSHQIRRDLARSDKISPDPVRSHLIWNHQVNL